MLLLNFGHPLADAHLAAIRNLSGCELASVFPIAVHLDQARPFAEQVRELVDAVPLTTEQWQTAPLIVNPPTLAPVAAALIAEMHGRSGYFPTLVRLRPIADGIAPQFEVAELLHLQSLRDSARQRRT
ncbi:MAG TPA: CRISPR-associated protein Csx15 [Lacipirellulaceae bacterium]|nr:CRISPR-associated protein Csx15 [Lacipirellulaceae bacterium]HMP05333.1 CRISPR-associated protein Csx15 [Lacipirellulaceae bacterium]